ncbi:MAG: phosphatase PAP2 family protein [Marmoricola sp.]
MSVTSPGGSKDETSLVPSRIRGVRDLNRLPLWQRVHRVPIWWFEILLVVAFDVAYEHVRNMVRLQPVEAINHGLDVLKVTEWFHLDLEQAFNQLLMNNHWLAQIANYDYATLHLPLTASVLIWVFWKHRDRYLPIRNVLLITTVLGLIGFWIFPTAPPRLLPGDGFVDTVVYFKTWGSWADPKVADATNQFAAMPSMHCAWALWCGLCLFFLAKNRVLRTFGVLYPLWTVFVVLGTANHFLLDAIAGIACVGLAVAVVSRLYGRHPWEAPDAGGVAISADSEPAPATA